MPTPSPFANPIFCAIDRPDLPGALALARALEGAVGGLKVGLELFTATGPDGVRAIVAQGLPVFLDLKLHDIPNTVAGAVRAACTLRPAMLTLHAAGGAAMLRAAVEAAGPERPWLLGVTLLTSLGPADLAATGIAGPPEQHVLRMAELCAACGLDGVICSPHEIAPLRRRFGAALRLVVPGIRGAGDARGDQQRTMPAADALALGADLLVVGRPITAAADPRAAAIALLAGLPRAA